MTEKQQELMAPETDSKPETASPPAKPNGKKPTIKQTLLSDERLHEQVSRALPKHLSADRFLRVAANALTRTPELLNCDEASFYKCLLELSQWGLEPDGRRAHLIPFRNNRRGVTECQLILDYKGLVELALRSGLISKIHADVVCENDEFEYDRGEVVRHRIDFRKPRGEMYAAYCIIRFRDGAEKSEVMTKEEIDAVRARSMAGRNGPWVTDYNEMAKKTVFRRASKWLPLSAEIRDAIEADDEQFDLAKPVVHAAPGKSLDALTEQL